MSNHSNSQEQQCSTELEWLRDLAARASTLSERLEGSFEPVATPDEVIDLRIDRWRRRVGARDLSEFGAYLEVDGLDLTTVRPLLGSVRLARTAPLPAWAVILNSVRNRMRARSVKHIRELIDNRYPISFEELLYEFAEEGNLQIRQLAGRNYEMLTAQAHSAMRRRILWRLSWLFGRALTREFDLFRKIQEPYLGRIVRQTTTPGSDQLYWRFVENYRREGLHSIFSEYPVLARLAALSIELWIKATAEFINRLAGDLPEISQRLFNGEDPGLVTMVASEMSDRHNNGRSVSMLSFASGKRLIYKPRSLAIEAAWSEFLRKLDGPVKLRALSLLDKGDYGWVEYIEPTPQLNSDEVGKFYHRAGALLGLLHVLRATDGHYENLIASSADPVLVDAEAVLHHEFRRSPPRHGVGAHEMAFDLMRDSVLRVGLLPQWGIEVDGSIRDKSGLGAASGKSARRAAIFKHERHDDLRMRLKKFEVTVGDIVPEEEGKPSTILKHQQSFVRGYRETMTFVAANKAQLSERLDGFSKLSSRVISRPTGAYSSLLEDGLSLALMRDGIDRSLYFSSVSGGDAEIRQDAARRGMAHTEIRDLDRLDIPIFTAPVAFTALSEQQPTAVTERTLGSSLETAKRKLAILDDYEIQRQIELIECTLYSRHIDVSHRDSTTKGTPICTRDQNVDRDWLGLAQDIACRLDRAAIKAPDRSCTWIGFEHKIGSPYHQREPVSPNLYSGSAGIAVFFAALFDCTREKRWRDRARGALAHIRQDVLNDDWRLTGPATNGGVSGYGGLIYAFCLLHDLIGDDDHLQCAKRIAERLNPMVIFSDRVFDLCHGVAGTALGLLSLWRRSDNQAHLDQAITCGEHLLKRAKTDHDGGALSWRSTDSIALTGMSHGTSGIAMALGDLAAETGFERFMKATRSSLMYERQLYNPQFRNWPDLRDSSNSSRPSYMISWCHGAPGIGMSRARVGRALDDPALREEISIAAFTTNSLKYSLSDSLCCGNFGRADALLVMAKYLGESSIDDAARKMCAVACSEADIHGGYSILPSIPRKVVYPGLFQGIAGIGYTLLRLYDSVCYPSVICFEDRLSRGKDTG